MSTELILATALSFVIGAIVAYVIAMGKVKNITNEKEKEAELIIEKAKERAQEIKRTAKSDAKQIVNDEKDVLEKEYQKKQQSLIAL